MKRGQPLARRSELRRTPFNRRSSMPLRGSGLNRVSRKRAKENARRRITVSAMRLASQGRCARCGRRDMPVSGHERLGRAQGGDILAPDCLLDNECNTWCEDNPIAAAWTGWKVSSKHPHSPALTIGQAWDLEGRIVDFAVLSEDVA